MVNSQRQAASHLLYLLIAGFAVWPLRLHPPLWSLLRLATLAIAGIVLLIVLQVGNKTARAKMVKSRGAQPDSVSAYMWYLLAEKTAAPMLEQIAEGKKAISRKMSPQQLAEAEGRAAAWLRNKKHSGFVGDGEVQTGAQPNGRAAAR